MLPKIIFCSAVTLATLAVILLSLFSPVPHRRQTRPWLALSLYIQQSQVANSNTHQLTRSDADALIFHRILTEGPENTSQIVGKAQGFIIPVEHFSHSAFNIIYLTFDTHKYSGSLSVEAKNFGHKDREELNVVGGTGSFAFARGLAVFAQTGRKGTNLDSKYHIKLQLEFPNRSQIIPG